MIRILASYTIDGSFLFGTVFVNSDLTAYENSFVEYQRVK